LFSGGCYIQNQGDIEAGTACANPGPEKKTLRGRRCSMMIIYQFKIHSTFGINGLAGPLNFHAAGQIMARCFFAVNK